MINRVLILFCAVVALVGTAQAANEPIFEPAPDWVEHIAIPAPDPARPEQAVQILLNSNQNRFGIDTDEFYFETATLVQTPQGLGAIGTISIPWQPELRTLVIHKVHLIRNGEVIDLMGNGQEFIVLRRENNLEQAMLDGVLTAVLQPEGLEVGDILNLAYTIRTLPSDIAFGSEDFMVLTDGLAIRQLHMRQIWPREMEVQWQSSDALGEPVVRSTREGSELTLILEDAKGDEIIEDAPARFQYPATFQISSYPDWAAVSTLFAPLYAEAQRLEPDSVLLEEIATIAAASDDPRQRAMAALRLVQDRVRYVALAMGDGGYVPASAGQTWSRRFGDCKGKTALLLALLHGLGIEAEPALVSTSWGDILTNSLPQTTLFDHVIVRAVIDGRTLWLDGTRQGDRLVEDVVFSPYRWALPVRVQGASLEELPPIPPARPLMEIRATADASRGFNDNVPVSGQIIFRGETALMMQLAANESGSEEMARLIQESMIESLDVEAVANLEIANDDETGEFSISFSGEMPLPWARETTNGPMRYTLDNDIIDWNFAFERDEESDAPPPITLPFPAYFEMHETVILPDDGEGFSIEGDDIDEVLAGTQLARTLTLEDGRAVSRLIFRRLQFEISAEQARADLARIEEIGDDQAYIVAPQDYSMSSAERTALIETEPTTAADYIRRGFLFITEGQFEQAATDFGEAANLEPENAEALAHYGLALVYRNRLDEAQVALDRAVALDPENFVVHQSFGLLHMANNRPEAAIEAYGRSLEISAENFFTRNARAQAHAYMADYGAALADYESLYEVDPSAFYLLNSIAEIHAAQGDEDAALASAREFADRSDSNSLYIRLLRRFGREDDAMRSYTEARASLDADIADTAEPDVGLLARRAHLLANFGDYPAAIEQLTVLVDREDVENNYLNDRCWMRMQGNYQLSEALSDCQRALDQDSENAGIMDSLAWVQLRMGRIEQAAETFDRTLELQPLLPSALYGRSLVHAMQGNREAANRDLAAARRGSWTIVAEYGDWLGDMTPPETEPAETQP
ncbi:Tfp pilus assembly protein PilF [Parasphingopyxis lamellibrachiae]|uniref:Tfp pilus assembly protein PilF n=2 Tax=Parasphingopyxis lamellibrachiae TaxID=680125 RepID=A0A3D9FF38_9SPHN|nr:Tfp pilus assembly protein PilF [Parasphingopyxis lamellibrachiae]